MDYAAYASRTSANRDNHAASARVVYEGARRRRSKGIAVRKGAPGSKSLKRDLDRYERDCERSAPKKFKGKRRKSYCAGVAWKRARKAGRHKTYFRGVTAAKETTKMARKRRMPKRGPGGKFVKRSSHRRRRRARAMAAEAPRKVRRHRRRRARAVEAPKRRRRRARRTVAPRRRRRRARAVEAPRRRRRRARAAAPRRRRRRSRARDPRGTHIYRRRPRVRRRTRRIAGKRRRVTLVSPRRRRGRALENPLTGGELVVGGITGVLGYVGADVLDRFLATHALGGSATAGNQGGSLDTPAAGQVYNYQAVAAPMGIKRWGAGLGVAAVPIILAGFVKGPMARSSLQFFGIGALLRTLGKGATDLMVMLTGKGATGMRLYADEISASNAAKTASTSTNQVLPAIAPIALQGIPQQVGRRIGGCCANCASGLPCTNSARPRQDPIAPGVTANTSVPPQANPTRAAGLPPASVPNFRPSPIPKVVLGTPSWRSKRVA